MIREKHVPTSCESGTQTTLQTNFLMTRENENNDEYLTVDQFSLIEFFRNSISVFPYQLIC